MSVLVMSGFSKPSPLKAITPSRSISSSSLLGGVYCSFVCVVILRLDLIYRFTKVKLRESTQKTKCVSRYKNSPGALASRLLFPCHPRPRPLSCPARSGISPLQTGFRPNPARTPSESHPSDRKRAISCSKGGFFTPYRQQKACFLLEEPRATSRGGGW